MDLLSWPGVIEEAALYARAAASGGGIHGLALRRAAWWRVLTVYLGHVGGEVHGDG